MKVESAHVKLAPGGLLTEDYNLLCHTKTTDYKMMVIVLNQNSPILLVRTTILLAGTPRAFATSICRSKGMQ